MAVLWATSYPLGRYLASYEAPQAIVVVRALVAFAFLMMVALSRSEARIKLSPGLISQLIVLGICSLCLHNFLLFEALEHTQAQTGAVINGAIPAVVLLFDYVIFRRSLGSWSVVGVAISFVGTSVVITRGELSNLLTATLGYGETLFIIGVFAWAVYTILARPLLERYPASTVTAYSCLAGAVLMLPWVFANLDASRVLLSEPRVVGLLALQGFLSIGVGFLWYYEGVQQLGALKAAVYINLVPVFGVSLSILTIGEVPELPVLIGGSFVVGGLLLVNRMERRRQL
ncbi:MAG: drug/metabolite transporter (DMT)-like permease [Gammaproteobacteria bacterium]|jgi:drug/metabolite transporter (DMT)-like permease